MIATLLSGVAFASPAFAQATNNPPPANPQAQPELNAAPTDQTPAQQENAADTPGQDRQDTQKGAAETIVVTGSRIVSPNITSLAPVQVVGEQDIDKSGAVNIQEVLLENPAFGSPALSTTNSAFLTSGAGTATVDLRDLGSNRTLVLINNRRVVGGLAGSPIVDLNTIPTQFIERVDILTGGASSLYGSDAVAGVVNFILKRNFEGLLLEGQYGITQHGDWPRYQISATAGANVADGRGNIMVHLGYSDDKGLLSRERANTRVDDFDSMYLLGGPTYDPKLFGVQFEPYFSSFPPQGRFTAGGYTFTYGNNGALQPCFTTNGPTCDSLALDSKGNVVRPRLTGVNGGFGTGPNGFNRQFYRTLSTPVKRWLFAEQAHYDITDNITFISEATYAKTIAKSEIEPFPMDSGGASGVFSATGGVWDIQSVAGGACNPLVPAPICAAATDTNGNGLKDVAFRKRLSDFGTRNLEANRTFFRAVAGFEGKIFNDRWNWDLTYNYGRTEESQVSNGQVNADHLRQALTVITEDATTGDINKNGHLGDIVCADPIARSTGCVPLDLFGVNSISPAAVQFVAAETNHTFRQTQQVVNANLSGSVVDLPAGPLGLAVGAEYRREASEENWDALTNVGGNLGNALPDVSGKFDVKEAYAEVNVPILKDMAFAKQLNLRAAGRVSDYSTIGSTTTWNVGGDYAPIDDIRFRATYAKSVRAPNIGELFSGAAQTFPTGILDPCLGVTLADKGTTVGDQCLADPGVLLNVQKNGKFTLTQPDKQGVSGFNIGNPNLGPETSKSFTAGVVINPRSISALRNLVLSVDYWHIKIADAIIAPGRNTILDQCYNEGNQLFCGFVTRYPTQLGASSPGALQYVNSVGINAAEFNAAGIDTVLQYRTRLGFMPGLTANARLSWTHYLKGYTVPLPGTDKDPFAGEIETAKDKVNGTIAFNTAKWGWSFTGNYIGKSYEDNVFLEGLGLGAHDVYVKGKFYLDTQASFTPTKNYEFFVGVDNLLDTKAPNILSGAPFNVTGSDTDAGVYDVFGRRFYAGARLRF
jgi:outer membrane receptor protein involved in Fe transport